MCLIAAVPQFALADVPEFIDDFDGAGLDPAWVTWDGYAVAEPADTVNHTTFSVASSKLTFGIPGGVGHNQWWLEHSQVTRPYEGSGVYEIKMDSLFEEGHQFGIVFESSPGTFVMCMLYSSYYIWGYIEQFTFRGGSQYRSTFPAGGYTNLDVVPQAGPFYIRVTLRDDPDPSLRNWKFEWSTDDSAWHAIFDGVVESSDPTANIGAIQRVGVFAGNHSPDFTALDARLDYYETYPEPASEVPAVGPSGESLLTLLLLGTAATRLIRKRPKGAGRG